MRVDALWLTDYRNYETAELRPAPGLTAVVGANGEGKTNLLEAVGYLATLSSFRGAPGEALVRVGAPSAVVRAEVTAGGRTALVEAELQPAGRDRVMVNRSPLRRARDLLGTLRVSVFSPDDVALVKGGPAERRRLLDDTLVACAPRLDAVRSDLDRVLRQRNTLLKQAGGRLTAEVGATLDVWDAKFAALGEDLVGARERLVARLAPVVAEAYDRVAEAASAVALDYVAPWREAGLAAALAAARPADLRRGVTTVGPHRDDLVLGLGVLPARTHASSGEQRSLALALRLAAHEVVTEVAGSTPVLLLDDVFSELDPGRSAALLTALPAGQALLTTAGSLPAGAHPELVVRVGGGRLLAAARDGGPVSTSDWEPRPGDTGPRPVGSSLDAVARHLGVVNATALTTVFSAWSEVVGEAVAAHSAPAALTGGRLTVRVDDPAWATQLRWLGPALLGRLGERLGAGVVTELDVRVRRPE